MRRSLAISIAVALAAGPLSAAAQGEDDTGEGAAEAEPAYLERPARRGRRFPVTIASEPEGATIYLDGREYGPVGTTPHRTRLPVGKYVLLLELDGYELLETTIRVKRRRRGRQRFVEELVPKLLGMISVAAPPGIDGDAVVNVDGEPVGYAPIDYEIDLGPHEVVVELDDGRVFEEWVEVTIEEPVRVSPRFEIVERAPEPEPEPEPAAPTTVRARGSLDTALVVASAGLEFGGRYFRYSGVASNNLRPYDAFGVPLFRASAQLHPLAGADNVWLRGLGVEAGLALAPALESRPPGDGDAIDTTWLRFEIGARIRHRVGDTIVAASVGFSREAFDFADGNPIEREVPDVDYRAVYLGADARAPVGAIDVFGGLRLMPVLAAGETADRFSGASVFGVGARAGAAYRLGGGLEMRGEAVFRGFFYGLAAGDEDEFVADGAVDAMTGFTIAAAYVY